MDNRYSRQLLYSNIGEGGQRLLGEKTVVIVGLGALGSLSSEMLARAGVGRLILIDRDYVEATNLQRQTLYNEEDAAEKKPKAAAAHDKLVKINSSIDIEVHIAHCDAGLIEAVAKDADLILDGTDNFDTRMLINDAAFKHNIPWIYAACVEGSYSSAAFVPGDTPCFRCLTPVLPSTTLTCDTAGIIGPAVHMAVSNQVTTALKILTEQFNAPYHLHIGNVWDMDYMKFNIGNMTETDCPTCQTHEYPELNRTEANAMKFCGRDMIQFIDGRLTEPVVKSTLKQADIAFKETPYFIEFNYEETRIVSFSNGRMLMHNVENLNKARTIVNQLFG
ncbi:Molybdopterin-synthase adenylyltransferase [Jeotgalicoccus saudimassiliensis]|uniref:Molybdopterin-synthase adenylyltransferase n=1 Tax=Jeotgalicoccus saudimassiliensis TaxID=1461582 RepID=A0A078M0N6_9STAP|nr:ThiF family adenylyltransferase [Jeotgalicoccus saudimassiliensis]CDZ98967.1 Molybdopterin-synthase adenylyltransferase [Jeotgalicoccus saudimassiliensis]